MAPAPENVTPLHPKPGANKKLRVNLLSDPPAIGRYLDRIGAKAKSPRTATITTEGHPDGYERDDIAIIKLSPDGVWHVPDALAPTEEEREAIERQLNDYQWPVLQKLANPKLPPEVVAAQKAHPGSVFEFRDRADNLVVIQVRIELKNGGKKYVPWTLWYDGQWRSCEPDEPLPLWGAEQLKHHSVVFLHEGAKAARWARKFSLMRARKEESETAKDWPTAKEKLVILNHPWIEELSHAAHLGWIGGAPNPHRTDWSPLRRGVHRIFIVADNETVGVDAIAKISKELSGFDVEVYAIRFDSRFPLSFDLADDFFDTKEGTLWNWREPATEGDVRTKRYIGPSFRELMSPATWAVEEVPEKAIVEAKGRRPRGPVYRLRNRFRDQWAVAKEMEPVQFINRWDPTRLYKEDNFNKKNRPFSGPVANLATLMMKETSVEVDTVSYEPGQKTAELVINRRRTFNTWTPSLIHPVTDRNYNPQPWLDYLTFLFPNEEERTLVMRWCATLIAKPKIRMTFGLLLVSEHHGIGKTTLAQILAKVIGEHNASWPNETDIVDSQFNSWIARTRLVVCNEIYSGHSWKAYNKLKSYISDKDIDVNEKHIRPYRINNWAHMILCSNSTEALKMDQDDRRIYQPTVSETKKPGDWWIKFHAWLAGDGYGIILNWAHVFLESHDPIGPEMHPPMTVAKQKAIDASTDDDQLLAEEIGKQAIAMGRAKRTRVILTDRAVQEWAALKLGLRRDDASPKAQSAFRRALRHTRVGLRKAGLSLVQEYQVLGRAHEAYGNIDPLDGPLGDWKEKLISPEDVERWVAQNEDF